MTRLTFEGNFCDIAMCGEIRYGSYCEDGYCSQRKVWERLKKYEDAEAEGRLVVLPCKIGTHLWRVTHPYRAEPKVTEYEVKNFRTAGKKHVVQLEVQAMNVPGTNWMEYKSFFTTREEAEEALRKER